MKVHKDNTMKIHLIAAEPMPEEINRIVTDFIADYLWTPSVDGNQNLWDGRTAKRIVDLIELMK